VARHLQEAAERVLEQAAGAVRTQATVARDHAAPKLRARELELASRRVVRARDGPVPYSRNSIYTGKVRSNARARFGHTWALSGPFFLLTDRGLWSRHAYKIFVRIEAAIRAAACRGTGSRLGDRTCGRYCHFLCAREFTPGMLVEVASPSRPPLTDDVAARSRCVSRRAAIG